MGHPRQVARASDLAPSWRAQGRAHAGLCFGRLANAQEIGDQLGSYVAKGGFKAVKMRVGAMDGTHRIRRARQGGAPAFGPRHRHHGRCPRHLHGRRGQAFRQPGARLRPCLVRGAGRGRRKTGIAEVRQSCQIPIAAGESEFTRFDFRDLIAHRAVDVLQPDLAICGGITEARRIDALAASYNLRLAPHLWAGAPAFFAGLHLAAASSSSFILEYSLGANPMLHDLIEENVGVEDGMVGIPDRPGLGITIREDVLKAHAVKV